MTGGKIVDYHGGVQEEKSRPSGQFFPVRNRTARIFYFKDMDFIPGYAIIKL
jgi:hypothetical protein